MNSDTEAEIGSELICAGAKPSIFEVIVGNQGKSGVGHIMAHLTGRIVWPDLDPASLRARDRMNGSFILDREPQPQRGHPDEMQAYPR
jgi:hypothetical protein